MAENLNDRELGLLCCGLQELEQGNVPLGGNSSRGLGGCRLHLARITAMELDNAAAWLDRLLGTEPKSERGTDELTGDDTASFMKDAIRHLFRELGVS